MYITPKGKEISEKLNAEKIFSKYSSKLIAQMEENKPDNAYDIQQIAMSIAKKQMETYFNSEELLAVKDQAFKNGLLTEDVMAIFGILLRDKYLQLKGISLSDID